MIEWCRAHPRLAWAILIGVACVLIYVAAYLEYRYFKEDYLKEDDDP